MERHVNESAFKNENSILRLIECFNLQSNRLIQIIHANSLTYTYSITTHIVHRRVSKPDV